MAFDLTSIKKRLKGHEGGEEDVGEVAVDPQALEAFAAGARERRGAEEEPPPWEGQDPEALPRYNVSIRLNDYHMAMLRYLAQTLDISQQKLLRGCVLPAVEVKAKEVFEERRLQ